MDLTSSPGHLNHQFVAEDAATLRAATEMTPNDMNGPMNELVNIILAAQIAPNANNHAQVLAALQALFLGKTGGDMTGPINQKFSGLYWQGTPAGGAFVRKYADVGNAATVGAIEDGTVYNCAVDPVSGVWAGRDVADICWLEKWSDAGGLKEFWYAPTAAAGAAPVWTKVFALDMAGGGMYLAQEAGHVAFFARPSAPAGYLKANGALVSRTTYANLFSALGTNFGVGDGATTFALPDFRGEFLRGFDDSRGIDTGRVFGSWQADDVKNHNHSIVLDRGSTNGAAPSPYPIGTQTQNSSPTTTNIGGVTSGGVESRPRNIALLACIKY